MSRPLTVSEKFEQLEQDTNTSLRMMCLYVAALAALALTILSSVAVSAARNSDYQVGFLVAIAVLVIVSFTAAYCVGGYLRDKREYDKFLALHANELKDVVDF